MMAYFFSSFTVMNAQHNLLPKNIVKIGLRYGLMAFTAYAVYFLLMRLLGLATIVELRFLNYIFLAVAAYYALRKAEAVKGWRLQYLQGMAVVFCTGLASFAYFCVFIFIYSVFDSFIIDTFFNLFTGAQAFGKFAVPFLIASEGISISAIIS